MLLKWLNLVYVNVLGLREEGRGVSILNPFVILILSFLGIAFIYAVQSEGTAVKWKMQLTWLIIGSVVYFLTSILNYKVYLQTAHILYFLSIITLLLLWTPIGRTIGGSRRWVKFFGIFLQPSDFSKISTLIFTASLLTRTKLDSFAESIGTLTKVAIGAGIPFTLIFLQPDLGSALVLPAIVFSLLFVSRLSIKFFVATATVFALIVGLVAVDSYAYYKQLKNDSSCKISTFLPIKNYQRNRILAFAAPDVIDPSGTNISWHLRQSLIAIGSGGLFGKGWTKNTQAKLGYLPKAASFNDFIFSVLAEETGLLGTSFTLLMYAVLILNTFRIAVLAKDRFGCYLAVGIAVMLLTHIWINVGMTLGIMPITGIPLPFLSYGGSFMIICFFSQGIVQSIYRFRNAKN